MPKAPAAPQHDASRSFRVRRSPIHGTGVFATQRIPKGARVVEYIGDRVSHAEADRRYEDKDPTDNHTFLFTVDDHIVIDAGVGGNAARWINHSCDPNCETVIEDKRVYIEAAREIGVGDELAYDYMITRDRGDPPDIEEIFACRCGAATCRGTMLLPPEKKRKKPVRRAVAKRAVEKRRAPGKRAAVGQRKAAGRAGGKSKTKTKTKTKAKTKAKAKASAKARAGAKSNSKARSGGAAGTRAARR